MVRHCPRCSAEYEHGYAECPNCRVPLAAGSPSGAVERREPELAVVLEARDTFALGLAKAALDEAGIAYVVSEEDPGLLPGIRGGAGIGATPLWRCQARILVAREWEEEARALLEPLRNPLSGPQ